MDKIIEPQKRKSANNSAIQDTITKFIGLRNEFVSLRNIALELHFGLERRGNDLWTNNPLNKLVYEPYIKDGISSNIYHRDKSRIVREFPMVLEHKLLHTGRLGLILKQEFRTVATRRNGKESREILFDPKQKVSKKNGYYYRWTFKGDSVTISKMIGTTDVNQIKKQGESLVKECQRFIFCYCQG